MFKLPQRSIFLNDLDQLSCKEIIASLKSLKNQEDTALLENELGNRILYPSALPVSQRDLNLDLAVLKEVLKKDGKRFYEPKQRKIFIPEDFTNRFPNLLALTFVFAQAFKPRGITSLLLETANIGSKNLGSLIKPDQSEAGGEIGFWVNGKKYQIKQHSLTQIPAFGNFVAIKFSSKKTKLLGQADFTTQVGGGAVGIIFDNSDE